jgi:hypothetical protein
MAELIGSSDLRRSTCAPVAGIAQSIPGSAHGRWEPGSTKRKDSFVGQFALKSCTALSLALAATLSGCQARSVAVAESVQQHATPTATRTHAAPAKPPAQLGPPTTPCTTSDLSVAPAAHHVTIGVDVERFTVSTTKAAGCTLTGTPNLRPKGPLSAQVPGATIDLAASQQSWPDDLDVQPPDGVTVPVLPGKPASFYLAWFSASSVVCEQSNGFGFNVPGDTTYTDMLNVGYPVGSLCDGVFYVSAVF